MTERIHVEVQGGGAARPAGGGVRWLLALPGLVCLALGVVILVWPRVLEVMVACFFLLLGVGLLLGARRVGTAARRFAFFEADMRR